MPPNDHAACSGTILFGTFGSLEKTLLRLNRRLNSERFEELLPVANKRPDAYMGLITDSGSTAQASVAESSITLPPVFRERISDHIPISYASRRIGI